VKASGARTAAGRLRHRVELQSATTTLNAAREPIPTWTTYARRWAHIAPTGSGTEWTRGQLRVTTTYTVTLRHDRESAGLTTKHRLTYGDRVFSVVGVVNPGERDRLVSLTCTEDVTEVQ
jgi:SPP1 family predicted phage head-tail adaptor